MNLPHRLMCGLLACVASALVFAADAPPRSGKVEILPLSQVKPGMQTTAWTTFQGVEAEAVPVEIIGVWKNAWGPKQDIILGKMGGKAARTGVAGGMSGSPVYFEGKLIGAVSLRVSVFSPDAICGITPIELMLDINELDKSSTADARVPSRAFQQMKLEAAPVAAAGGPVWLTPIEAPLTFSGFHPQTLAAFSSEFRQMGLTPVQGGAGGGVYETKPATSWKDALHPGQPITAVLVSGDMNITALGTTTWNDGQRVLGFGHPFFNLGAVNLPVSKGEILTILASSFQPNKVGNSGEIVGALKQDRHSGIMGRMGEQAPTIPVQLTLRSHTAAGVREKPLRLNVCVQQKWTPFLMTLALFNSLQGINEFSDEATYRLSGDVQLDKGRNIRLDFTQSTSDLSPMPAPMVLATWVGDRFNRLFGNPLEDPHLEAVRMTVDLYPERRVLAVENAWLSESEVDAGQEIMASVWLRPWRGERVERKVRVPIPANLPKGEYRLQFSDATTLNRMQSIIGAVSPSLDINQTVSLLNKERPNHRLYTSIVSLRPTVYFENQTMPDLPASLHNLMQTGRTAARPLAASAETATELSSADFDQMVAGSFSVRFTVR
jgi:hypothetical protein